MSPDVLPSDIRDEFLKSIGFSVQDEAHLGSLTYVSSSLNAQNHAEF
jgi:hypothetical protein